MPDAHVNLHRGGPPETELDPVDPVAASQLAAALALPPHERRDAVAAVVARSPRYLAGWAALGANGRDDIERYAAYRVGYHRGLDALRAAGWRGSGYLRWSHEPNRGFLAALAGLGETAESIGEIDEAHRCRQFLNQLDPEHFPSLPD